MFFIFCALKRDILDVIHEANAAFYTETDKEEEKKAQTIVELEQTLCYGQNSTVGLSPTAQNWPSLFFLVHQFCINTSICAKKYSPIFSHSLAPTFKH